MVAVMELVFPKYASNHVLSTVFKDISIVIVFKYKFAKRYFIFVQTRGYMTVLMFLCVPGFTHDLFNFGTDNEEKSVEVNFFSADGKIVPCDIHKDGCTITQITCYTRKYVSVYLYILVYLNITIVLENCAEYMYVKSSPRIDCAVSII